MPSEVRFGVVKKMLEAKGYFLHHVTGSHHIFKRADGGRYTLTVHHGKVKPFYVQQVQNLKEQ